MFIKKIFFLIYSSQIHYITTAVTPVNTPLSDSLPLLSNRSTFFNSQSLFLEPDVFSLNLTGFLQKRLVNDFNDTHFWFLVQETYLLIVSWVCYSKLFSSVHIWIIWRQSSFWILCFQNAKGFQFSKCQSIYNVGRILLLF